MAAGQPIINPQPEDIQEPLLQALVTLAAQWKDTFPWGLPEALLGVLHAVRPSVCL